MRRDADLLREILLHVEGMPDRRGLFGWAPEGRTEAEVVYHLELLRQAGLIGARVVRTVGRRVYVADVELTWAGHEFLDDARNDAVWRGAQALLREQGVDASFAVLAATVRAVAMRHATERLGLVVPDSVVPD